MIDLIWIPFDTANILRERFKDPNEIRIFNVDRQMFCDHDDCSEPSTSWQLANDFKFAIKFRLHASRVGTAEPNEDPGCQFENSVLNVMSLFMIPVSPREKIATLGGPVTCYRPHSPVAFPNNLSHYFPSFFGRTTLPPWSRPAPKISQG